MTSPDSRKADYQIRLKRIEGQVRHVRHVLDPGGDDEGCDAAGCDTIEVLTQLTATITALRAVAQGLVDEHVGACLAAAAAAHDPLRAQQKVAEASQAVARLVRF